MAQADRPAAPGGYIKLWRQIRQSAVYQMPPLYLRIWERLLMEANHSDQEIPYKPPGGAWTRRLIERGSRLTSLRQIAEWVGWYERGRWKVPNIKTVRDILRWLEEQGMIRLGEPSSEDGCKGLDLDSTFALCKRQSNDLGNTRETFFTVVNYDLYQDKCNDLGNEKETVTGSKQECIKKKTMSSSSTTQSSAANSTRSRKKSEPDPRVKPVIDYFAKKHREATGMPYVVNGGKDGTLIKNLPAEYTTEVLVGLIDVFFADKSDPYVWQRAGPTLGVFITKLSALASKTHKATKGGDDPCQMDEATFQRLAAQDKPIELPAKTL